MIFSDYGDSVSILGGPTITFGPAVLAKPAVAAPTAAAAPAPAAPASTDWMSAGLATSPGSMNPATAPAAPPDSFPYAYVAAGLGALVLGYLGYKRFKKRSRR